MGSSLGSEASGRILHYLEESKGWTSVDAYHALFWVYSVMGIVNALLVLLLTSDCEMEVRKEEAYARLPQNEDEETRTAEAATAHVDHHNNHDHHRNRNRHHGRRSWASRSTSWITSRLAQISPQTRSVMYKLWFLLSIDSIADGMVPYSLTNYYMDVKFQPAKSTLGDVQSAAYSKLTFLSLRPFSSAPLPRPLPFFFHPIACFRDKTDLLLLKKGTLVQRMKKTKKERKNYY